MTLLRPFLFVIADLLVVLPLAAALRLSGAEDFLRALGVDPRLPVGLIALFGLAGALYGLLTSRARTKRLLAVTVIDPARPEGVAASRLVESVSQFCAKAELAVVPEIGVYPSPEINALAVGASRNSALLAVSTGLLETLDSKALEGILAHEVAQIANGGMVTMGLLQGLADTFVSAPAGAAATTLAQILQENEEGHGAASYVRMTVTILLESLLLFLAAPLIYCYSRYRLRPADRDGAGLTSAKTLAHALESLSPPSTPGSARIFRLNSLMIQGRSRTLIAAACPSHPPLEARITLLNAL